MGKVTSAYCATGDREHDPGDLTAPARVCAAVHLAPIEWTTQG